MAVNSVKKQSRVGRGRVLVFSFKSRDMFYTVKCKSRKAVLTLFYYYQTVPLIHVSEMKVNMVVVSDHCGFIIINVKLPTIYKFNV